MGGNKQSYKIEIKLKGITKMKTTKIFLIALCALLLAPGAFAQFNTAGDVVTWDSLAISSSIVDLNGKKLGAIILPATFTGTSLTIQTSATNDTTSMKTIQYDGSDVSVTATDGAQCGFIPVEVNQLLRYIRFVSNAVEADDRTAYVVRTNF